jgi:hypothetical protein
MQLLKELKEDIKKKKYHDCKLSFSHSLFEERILNLENSGRLVSYKLDDFICDCKQMLHNNQSWIFSPIGFTVQIKSTRVLLDAVKTSQPIKQFFQGPFLLSNIPDPTNAPNETKQLLLQMNKEIEKQQAERNLMKPFIERYEREKENLESDVKRRKISRKNRLKTPVIKLDDEESQDWYNIPELFDEMEKDFKHEN